MAREPRWLKPVAVAVLVGAVLASVALAQRLSAFDGGGSNCTAAKIRAVDRKVDDILRCVRKAVLEGTGISESCFTAAAGPFKSEFQNAEHFGDCFTTGDVDSIEAKVDSFIEELLSELLSD